MDRYIRRVESGNFGAAKFWAKACLNCGKTLVILLGGGSKRDLAKKRCTEC